MKQCVSEDGILFTPRHKTGHGLKKELVKSVLDFYDDDEVSRVMPGQRDCVSEVKDGVRQLSQKRLLTMSLKETFGYFKETHADTKIGISSFAALRPKHCKLLGTSGSHNVCVCTIHENVDLILTALKKINLPSDRAIYTEKIMCKDQERSSQCYLRLCQDCSDTTSFEADLLDELEEKSIKEVSFEEWMFTDRCNIERKTVPLEEFTPLFAAKLSKFIYHDFIKTQQSQFLKNRKELLLDGEIIVICDFAENYSFVLQDEMQAFHWNNSQCTIHPFVVYYKDGNDLRNISFVVISDVLNHDTVAVQLFITKLLDFLKPKLEIRKCIFMSDGAASQYKNRKNFSCICGFKDKYNVEIEWHFFATSHGKGPCDAIGGTVKRMAARASLAKEHEHPITNPRQLYDWLTNCEKTKMSFCFVTTDEYKKASKKFSSQFKKAKPIPGTQKHHCFIPISSTQIATKLFSNSNEPSKLFDVYK